MRLEREIAGIQRWLGELSVLKTRFALVDDAKVLEQQLLAAKDAHDELAGALAHSRQFSSEDLEERLRDLEKRLKNVRQQLEHADNNSYARLREEFSQQDVERLMRLFNGALFSLPLGENGVNLDDGDVWVKSVEAILDHFKGEHFEAPGLSIDLSHIEPPALQALADRAALRDQKERLEKELKQLKTQQSVAADRAASKAQAEKLYQDVLDAQKALEDFRRTQTLTAEEPGEARRTGPAGGVPGRTQALQRRLRRARPAALRAPATGGPATGRPGGQGAHPGRCPAPPPATAGRPAPSARRSWSRWTTRWTTCCRCSTTTRTPGRRCSASTGRSRRCTPRCA